MKQIHIRRFLSLLLAALTLWAAAVTAGSDSAAAALQQLRQGSRLSQQALRWELGDFFGLDSLSAVTVMTLAQSPLLLAGRSTVAALLLSLIHIFLIYFNHCKKNPVVKTVKDIMSLQSMPYAHD